MPEDLSFEEVSKELRESGESVFSRPRPPKVPAPGSVCEHCGRAIGPEDDYRVISCCAESGYRYFHLECIQPHAEQLLKSRKH